jgi:hypothetical protein
MLFYRSKGIKRPKPYCELADYLLLGNTAYSGISRIDRDASVISHNKDLTLRE